MSAGEQTAFLFACIVFLVVVHGVIRHSGAHLTSAPHLGCYRKSCRCSRHAPLFLLDCRLIIHGFVSCYVLCELHEDCNLSAAAARGLCLALACLGTSHMQTSKHVDDYDILCKHVHLKHHVRHNIHGVALDSSTTHAAALCRPPAPKQQPTTGSMNLNS